MESSVTLTPAEPMSAAQKKAEKAAAVAAAIAAKKKAKMAAKRKKRKAAKKKAEKAAKKKVVNFAKERAKLVLAGWLTVDEVAKMLRLTPRRVRDFLLKGRLSAMVIGRTWFIQRKDVLAFSGIKRKPGRPAPESTPD